MKEYKTLYTVNDVAEIVGVTTRSIRNYMKNGTLSGNRMGGQWRFTREDIDKLLNSSKNNEKKYTVVEDFLNQEGILPEGNIQICSIVDFYCGNRIEAEKKAGNLRAIINGMNVTESYFEYEYIRVERKARFIVKGDYEFVQQIIMLIKG